MKNNNLLYFIGIGAIAAYLLKKSTEQNNLLTLDSQLNGINGMKTIDYTQDRQKTGFYDLTVRFSNGNAYYFYGTSKKMAENRYKAKFGSWAGVIEKQWSWADIDQDDYNAYVSNLPARLR